MVTFSIPGDDNVAAGGNTGTPRSRPPLPFAKRPLAASSSFGGSAKRLGTPQGTPGRSLLGSRDALSSSGSLGRSSISSTRNIFRASAMTDSPSATTFSPKLPQDTMTKLFAPGGTPNPSRTFRESTAQPSPRGMAAKASDKDLFNMRIASPPPDLTGEALSAKVPKDWNSKSSIYADQFLAHLCPADFDDEQRRQFFCILDLRRLKYAADEIFSKKTWKLNIMNFAKEFEKSRSIILLRYGLYEFQNVKPSREILKRWRREHGLPDPEGEEDSQPTPTKSSSTKKRKAADESADHATPSTNGGKRRAMDKEKDDDSASQQPSFINKNKRKASPSKEVDTQPAKMSKPTSASAALFGQIAEKHKASPAPATATLKQSVESPAPKPNLFGNKGTNGGALARSVFSNLKPTPAQGSSSPNIFGYLSDASSAKNSGVEADAESEADSEQDESQEAGQSDEPSVAVSGAETASQVGFGLLNKQPAPATASSSAPGTRESTPGRSLFDRVTKTSDGQLARADSTEPATTDRPAPVDQTWNPSSTPIKFAPTNATKPSFGAPTSAPASSLFAPKSTAASNIFGAAKVDQGSDKAASKESTPAATDKDGNESDKENDGQAPNKSVPETKAPAPQPSFGSSLFSTKPAGAEPAKDAEAPKPATNLFGSNAQPAVTNLFGSSAKPTGTVPGTPAAAPVMQSSTLFGANAAGSQTPAGPPPSTTSLFGASQAPAKADESSSKPSSLFATSQAASNTGNLFGRASPAPTQPLFGAPKTSTPAPEPEKKSSEAAAQPAATPIFSFGAPTAGVSQSAPKPLFGAPKSPTTGQAGGSLFSGSPMKQDEPSPAKKPFAGGTAAGAAAPTFSFGNAQSQPSGNLFGSATNNTGSAPANTSVSFGGASSNAGSGGFSFNFSGGTSAAPVNNPFSSGDKPASSAAPATGGMFSGFGGASTPAGGATPSFQFGAASGTGAVNSSGPLFGANQANSSTPAFGGSGTPASTGTPMFFTSASPQPGQGSAPTFGSNTPAPSFGNLQPPAGGASTTGTNSPFSLGGGSSLATTPAGGTPEPTSQAEGSKEPADDEEGEKQEQVNLTEGLEKDEDILHEVRAKALKFVPAGEKSEGEAKPKSTSPWSTRGVGPLRILKHKESGLVRLLLRAEPRGHVAINRAVLPDITYKADEKYVRLTTSNESGDGLETWMLQVKTKESAKELAETLEKNKVFNKK